MTSICMVGSGAIATRHMKAIDKLGGILPLWMVSRQENEAQEFGDQWRFGQFGTDLDVALADPKVDLVIIASPSEYHVDHTTRSLRAGKNVIVEIPVALSLSDAEHIAKLAEGLSRRVLVCHTMRSFHAIREVRRRVQTGQLHITHIAGHFAIPRRRNQGMDGRQRNWIDNLLWHHGCHMVDVAMWVLGADRAEHVSGLVGKSHIQFGMATDVSIHFRTSMDQLVSHSLTYNTEQFLWKVYFIGNEYTLTYCNGRLLNEANEQVIPEACWADLVCQDEEMLAAIANNVPSDYEVGSVLPAMRVLHEAQLSADAS